MTSALTIKKFYGEMVTLDQARELLATESDPRRVADFTKAVEAARTIDGKNDERRNYWGELSIWSTRRLGELIRDGQKKGTVATKGKTKMSHDATFTLDDLGIKRDQSARAQKLASIPNKTIRQYVDRQRESDVDQEIGKAGLLRYVGSDANLASKFTGNPEWYTPAKYIEVARAVMGGIDLDPASNPVAQKTVKASVYYTAKTDGLSHSWQGNVFLNPPFKMPLVAQFIDKLCEEVEAGSVKQAILLTNNNTDTKWWHQAATIASAVCFTYGRIKFYNAGGESSSPTNGQTFCYFGKHKKDFTKRFATTGAVMCRL